MEPIEAWASRDRVFLRLEEHVSLKTLGRHEAFAVAYRTLIAEYRPPLALTIYAGRQYDGRTVVAELSAQRTALTPADLNELAHLRFYLSPDGLRDPRKGKVSQPVGLWLFPKGRMLLACLEGTPERSLEGWLTEARKELPDRRLYGVAASYRKARLQVTLHARKKKNRWWAGAPQTPLQSFHPFRDPSFLDPPKERSRLAGILTHVGAGGTAVPRRRPAPPTEDGGSSTTQLDLSERSDLHRLGYKITGLSRGKRWRVLTERAVPALGLQEVARTIAGHVRRARSQRGGTQRFEYAISEWEHDLARLKSEIPDGQTAHKNCWPRNRPAPPDVGLGGTVERSGGQRAAKSVKGSAAHELRRGNKLSPVALWYNALREHGPGHDLLLQRKRESDPISTRKKPSETRTTSLILVRSSASSRSAGCVVADLGAG